MTEPESVEVGGHSFAGADLHNCVAVSVPARPDMWGLVRLAVSTVASKIQANVERIDDLRIAVSELCTLCAAGSGPSSVLRVEVRFDAAVMTASCTVTELTGHEEPDEFDLGDGFTSSGISRRILDALVESFEVSDVDATTRHGWFVARA